jgi:UPF0755 protein
MRAMLYIALGLFVALIAVASGAYLWIKSGIETPVSPGDTNKEQVNVPKGATLHQVGRLLEDAHFIKSQTVWRAFIRINGGKSPQAGRHEISRGMNMPQIMDILSSTPLSDDIPLTMVEGWRIRDADAWLADQKLIERGAYVRAAENPSQFKLPFPFESRSLEGYLLPETYMVPVGKVDAVRLIQRQIELFNERFYQPNKAEIERTKRSLADIVTVASMLEREEPTVTYRPQVAGIMYKRLDSNTPLGVDATSRYKLPEWNDHREFLKALRDAEDAYNTRARAGLPPSPIGAPSLESLVAALRPAETPYWYYLHDTSKHIHFGRTAAQHEANRKKYNVY